MKPIAVNRKAYHEYEILNKYEAGIVLTGMEIKSIREGRVNLAGGFCRIQNDAPYILNMHIAKAKEPERSRKLLMHKSEIQSLYGKTQQKGLTLIPLSLYIKRGKAKLEIGLGRGKILHDKRDQIRKRDLDRQAERDIKD